MSRSRRPAPMPAAAAASVHSGGAHAATATAASAGGDDGDASLGGAPDGSAHGAHGAHSRGSIWAGHSQQEGCAPSWQDDVVAIDKAAFEIAKRLQKSRLESAEAQARAAASCAAADALGDGAASRRQRGTPWLSVLMCVLAPLVASAVWLGYGGTEARPMLKHEALAALGRCGIANGTAVDVVHRLTATQDVGQSFLLVQLVKLRKDRMLSRPSDDAVKIERSFAASVAGAALWRGGHPLYAGTAVGTPYVVPESARVCPCLVPPSTWDVVYVTRWRSLRDAVDTVCDVGADAVTERWDRAVEREMAVVISGELLTLAVRAVAVFVALVVLVRSAVDVVSGDEDGGGGDAYNGHARAAGGAISVSSMQH